MPKGIFKNPKERSKKISRALKGIKLSDERRKNMSKAQKIRFQKYSAWNKGLKGAQVAWNKGRKWVERMGENHHNWKKGRIYSEQRYINILKPEHPFCKKSGYVFEHRLVAEKSLGRYLTGIEIIHHIDF